MWSFRQRSLKHAVLAASLFIAARAFGGTPDWLRREAFATLPTYPADTNAVLLLNEQITTVTDTGELRTVYRVAYKILRPQGRSYATVRVYFDSETQLTFLKGWCISQNQIEYEVKEKDAIETGQVSESLYSDERTKILQIPAADPGSVIGYEYQQRGRPSILQSAWYFQETIPVRRARYEIELPSNWTYKANWKNHAAVNPQNIGANRFAWELADLPAVPVETEMPHLTTVSGQMWVNLVPPTSGSLQSLQSWEHVARWYGNLASSQTKSTPSIQKKTAELISGVTEPMQKIRRLTSYVQKQVRYVSVEIGIGGYRPHPAEDIFSSGYGDCKDKATLLKVMLKEAGFDSQLMLVSTKRKNVMADLATPFAFNHAILAIPLPEGVDRNEVGVTGKDDKGNPLMFFDPTDSLLPLGDLPVSLQGGLGLVVRENGGYLTELPQFSASSNRLTRTANLTIDKDGTLRGHVEELRLGPSAAHLASEIKSIPNAERQKWFQNLISDQLDRATLTKASFKDDTNDRGSALLLSYDFVELNYVQKVGDLWIFKPSVLGKNSRYLLEKKERKHPVVFSHVMVETDTFEITYPEGFIVDELPQTVSYESPFVKYRAELIHKPNHIQYKRLYEVDQMEVPLEELSKLKMFFRKIADDERAFVVMKASAPNALGASAN